MKNNLKFWTAIGSAVVLILTDLILTIILIVKIVSHSAGGAVSLDNFFTVSIVLIALNAAMLIIAAGYFAYRQITTAK